MANYSTGKYGYWYNTQGQPMSGLWQPGFTPINQSSPPTTQSIIGTPLTRQVEQQNPYANLVIRNINGNDTVVDLTTGKMYSSPEELARDLGILPHQIDWNQISKEPTPTEEPFAPDQALELAQQQIKGRMTDEDALKQVQETYGPYYAEEGQQLTAESAEARRRAEEDYQRGVSEMEADREALLSQYRQYLNDIETGKLRVGTDFERETARALEMKSSELQNREVQFKRGMEQLNRQWMGRGGLFSGVRQEATGDYASDYQRALQDYLKSQEYTQGTRQLGYERSMEDYGQQATNLQRQQQEQLGAYQRGLTGLQSTQQRSLYDIAQEEARRRRSLKQEQNILYPEEQYKLINRYYQ